jgi:hypothetical protein
MPVNRDLSGADAQKAAEIDDDGLYHPAAIDDDIDDAAQILACCALHRLAEKGFGRIPVSNDGWRFRGCRGRRGSSPRLGEHEIRRSCEEGDLTVDYEGARGRHQDKRCTSIVSIMRREQTALTMELRWELRGITVTRPPLRIFDTLISRDWLEVRSAPHVAARRAVTRPSSHRNRQIQPENPSVSAIRRELAEPSRRS